MLAVAIVNYRTADATIACLQSLLSEPLDNVRYFVLDNGSGDDDRSHLQAFCEQNSDSIRFSASEINLGFAAGNNRLLTDILENIDFSNVLFLNSDTRPLKGLASAMIAKLDSVHRVDFVAAKMLDERDSSIDSLGITLFRSTLASNRKRDDEVLLGPSGGCALMTRRLLEDLRNAHGEYFDDIFFCYAEDTDLAVRSRWLGYRPAYADDAVLYHARSLSSGGPDNDFVLYHGIRNSIWWLIKNAPARWFVMSLPWFIVLHSAIWIRHLRRGKARVLWRLYRDAIKGIPVMRRKRRTIKNSRRVPVREFSRWVEPHFYQRDYVKRAWRDLFKSAPKP
jgi:N-acetylglucosaminyl-diphospho-decaprenol L-rhamnosyltransferase